ncbi:MAG: PilZ domain-containing protein [Terracidiphilus sp.]|jgi:hypothetical protein
MQDLEIQDRKIVEKRRGTQRFRVNAPLTVILQGRKVSAFTRDLSNHGMYFYMASADSMYVEGEFEFLVELPPEITLSTCCRIRGQARVMRKENMSRSLTGMGVGAEILDYSILRETRSID